MLTKKRKLPGMNISSVSDRGSPMNEISVQREVYNIPEKSFDLEEIGEYMLSVVPRATCHTIWHPITSLPWSLSLAIAVGARHVNNKYSRFLPLVCHKLSFAKTFTGPFFDVNLFTPYREADIIAQLVAYPSCRPVGIRKMYT